jgi:hypothetical protein
MYLAGSIRIDSGYHGGRTCSFHLHVLERGEQLQVAERARAIGIEDLKKLPQLLALCPVDSHPTRQRFGWVLGPSERACSQHRGRCET